MRIKSIFFLFFFLCSLFRSFADEGMWLPLLLQSLNEKEMTSMGFKLSAEDIYSVNKSSMKDAVVLFGRGCTAEIISENGLILTNHHCGYGQIQSHSSVENDYLTDGFWAMSKEQELPCPGLTATILVRMEDVTERIKSKITENMTEAERDAAISKESAIIVEEATSGNGYKAQVKPFYYGNEFYLIVFEVFNDVRLVGAPPSCIGKFGGDTDNWMWPRHTGDFSLFRIYTNKENKPAAYSKENVPYKPKYVFPISLKGVKENDFTFVFGYPGTTEHFTISDGVKMITEDENPIAIKMRRSRMDIMENYMKQDPAIRIQYASKHAGVGNYWKKMIGESKGIRQWNGIERKKAQEKEFVEKLKANNELFEKYKNLLPEMQNTYEKYKPYSLAYIYFLEGVYSIEAIKFIYNFRAYVDKCATDPKSPLIETEKERLQKSVEGFFNSYNVNIDRDIATMLMPVVENMPMGFLPKSFLLMKAKWKSNWKNAMDYAYDKSNFTSKEKNLKFLDLKPSKAAKEAAKDPLYNMSVDLFDMYFNDISEGQRIYSKKLDSLYRVYVYVKKLINDNNERFYPDANSTLRVAYGNVRGFQAADGINYSYFTTTDGVLEKEDGVNQDYYLNSKVRKMLEEKQFGQYADADGTLHTGFIATNHTTGGNSGSPVLNANGEIVGINFDRVWEGTMSDLMFDPSKCRNISVDIRYCLWVIDKYAGAGYLLDEMKIVK